MGGQLARQCQRASDNERCHAHMVNGGAYGWGCRGEGECLWGEVFGGK